MRLNILTNEVEGTPEEIALFLRNKSGGSTLASVAMAPEARIEGRKFYKNKKYTPEVISYLRKAYPLEPKEKILSEFQEKLGIKSNWLSIMRLASVNSIRRNISYINSMAVAKVRQQANSSPKESLDSTKICRRCQAVVHRKPSQDNFSWKKTQWCSSCFNKQVSAGRDAYHNRNRKFQGDEDFPRFSSVFSADEDDIKQVFYDAIANKGRIGKNKWEPLDIDNQNQWEMFVSESMRKFHAISDYFLSKNLFRVEKEAGYSVIVYGGG